MDKFSSHMQPDLIINVCPLGCNGTCDRIWINESIGHKIICNCTKCGHDKKQSALAEVWGPRANARATLSYNQGDRYD